MTTITNNGYWTRTLLTPSGRVGTPPQRSGGVTRVDNMGTDIEAGVAEAITFQKPAFISHIKDPICLSTAQMLALGMLGMVEIEGKLYIPQEAQDLEERIQTNSIDLIAMPMEMYSRIMTANKVQDFTDIITAAEVTEKCVTIQVKYQPFAYGPQYGTINFETKKRLYTKAPDKEKSMYYDKQNTYRDEDTIHKAQITVYVLTSQAMVALPTPEYKLMIKDLTEIPNKQRHEYGTEYAKKKKLWGYGTFTKRLCVKKLLSHTDAEILSMSPKFEEYHLKVKNCQEKCGKDWVGAPVDYKYYSQDWTPSTIITVLERRGVHPFLVGDGKLAEGFNLQGTVDPT